MDSKADLPNEGAGQETRAQKIATLAKERLTRGILVQLKEPQRTFRCWMRHMVQISEKQPTWVLEGLRITQMKLF